MGDSFFNHHRYAKDELKNQNRKRSEEFIKMKHSINSCKNILQLKGLSDILSNIKDDREYDVLLHYYEAMEKELELYSL